MGEVIQLADWRNRKSKQDPLGRGKTYSYRLSEVHEDKTAVIEHIGSLLAGSVEAEQSVYRLGTVQEREQAVIKGVNLRMAAHKYAEKHGFRIEQTKGDLGVSYFNIFETTK